MEADSKAAQAEMKRRVEEEKYNQFDGTFHIDGKRITHEGKEVAGVNNSLVHKSKKNKKTKKHHAKPQ